MPHSVSPALWRLVLEVWQSLPAEDQRALAGVAVVECAVAEMPQRLGDAGGRLIRLRADVAQHPAAKGIIAHELAHILTEDDVTLKRQRGSRQLLEDLATLRAAAWGYAVPRVQHHPPWEG